MRLLLSVRLFRWSRRSPPTSFQQAGWADGQTSSLPIPVHAGPSAMQIGFIIFVCLTAATVHLKPAPLVRDLQSRGVLRTVCLLVPLH